MQLTKGGFGVSKETFQGYTVYVDDQGNAYKLASVVYLEALMYDFMGAQLLMVKLNYASSEGPVDPLTDEEFELFKAICDRGRTWLE